MRVFFIGTSIFLFIFFAMNIIFPYCIDLYLLICIIIYPLQVALVYGQMNEPPGARARVALTGLTVAEYFRDVEGQDVLLFIDNIFRFTQAGSEVSIDCITLNV